jgi:hypothetical protein
LALPDDDDGPPDEAPALPEDEELPALPEPEPEALPPSGPPPELVLEPPLEPEPFPPLPALDLVLVACVPPPLEALVLPALQAA